MARTSTGVRFVLKNPKGSVSPVKVIFCYASKQFYYYERKLSIPIKFWNKNSQRAKETQSFPGFFEFNTTLSNIETVILDCYRKYKNDNNCDPSTEELRELVKSKRGIRKVENKSIEFMQFAKDFIRNAHDGKHLNIARGTRVTPNTVRVYAQTLRVLNDYSVYKKTELKFKDIDTSFHKEFTHFLSTVYISQETNDHLKINTIGKHLTTIKTIMNAALEAKVTTFANFKTRSFKVIREDVENIALSESEISAMEQLDLSGQPRLEKVRDMFLIGCETALRVSDLKRLRNENIQIDEGNEYIKIEMQKTGKAVFIPVSTRLKRIIQKYFSLTGNYFPQAISDQKSNNYIKEIAKQIPLLCETVQINSTRNGKRISSDIPKYEMITNHTSRRSFATNCARKGIPYHLIMKITGHSTEKSFIRYIKLFEMEGAKLFEKEMNKLAS